MSLFLEKVVEDGYATYNITRGGYFLVIVLMLAAVALVSYFTNADGTLSDKNRTQRAVDDINKVFNLLVFEPLYYTQSAWFNRKPEDTEW